MKQKFQNYIIDILYTLKVLKNQHRQLFYFLHDTTYFLYLFFLNINNIIVILYIK